MGLDLSVGEISHRMGPYSFFGNYRRHMFKFFHSQELDMMEGFYLGVDPNKFKNLKFADLKTQQMIPFINHSDYDGHITADEAAECLPDLELYKHYLELKNSEFPDDYLIVTERLIELFKHSMVTGLPVEFH
jgi:hypothetical protein